MDWTMRLATLIFSISFMGVSAVAQRWMTIRVPLPLGEAIAVVTFDATRVSKADVSRWMQLSEQGRYSAPDSWSYVDCTSDRRDADLKQLQADISKARKVVDKLDPEAYPPELSQVVMYLRRLQTLWLWLGEQELAFCQNGNTPELRWDDVDVREACASTISQLHSTRNADDGSRMVFFDWNTCVNRTVQSYLGPYPKKDWEIFLQAQDLRVRMIWTAGD